MWPAEASAVAEARHLERHDDVGKLMTRFQPDEVGDMVLGDLSSAEQPRLELPWRAPERLPQFLPVPPDLLDEHFQVEVGRDLLFCT
jgi:hypothetical protein